MTGSNDIIYRLNKQDEIFFVNEAWDRFAGANAGEGLASSRVFHRPLWDFITDVTTCELYRQILKQVRAGRPICFTFRCDSPTCRRQMAMEIHNGKDGTVEFRTHTLSDEEREAVPSMAANAVRSDEMLRVCGWCKKVAVSSSWEEVEVAVERLQLFERKIFPSLTHGICEACYQSLIRTLASS